MSETRGTEELGEPDERDAEGEDPSMTGKHEITAGEGQESESGATPGRLEEREQRQQGIQQHGDRFAVDTDEPTDTSIQHGAANRVTAQPGDESAEDDAAGATNDT